MEMTREEEQRKRYFEMMCMFRNWFYDLYANNPDAETRQKILIAGHIIENYYGFKIELLDGIKNMNCFGKNIELEFKDSFDAEQVYRKVLFTWEEKIK